jgi:hypothetical protein
MSEMLINQLGGDPKAVPDGLLTTWIDEFNRLESRLGDIKVKRAAIQQLISIGNKMLGIRDEAKSSELCSVDSCFKAGESRGMCLSHYRSSRLKRRKDAA